LIVLFAKFVEEVLCFKRKPYRRFRDVHGAPIAPQPGSTADGGDPMDSKMGPPTNRCTARGSRPAAGMPPLRAEKYLHISSIVRVFLIDLIPRKETRPLHHRP